MATTAPLDTTIEVVTPENIAFDYSLAGPFRRLPAYLIDIAIRHVVLIFLLLVALLVFGLLGITFQSSRFFSLFVGGGLAFYFFYSWFYGVLFETYFSGRTPGKWICGLRVIGEDGHPITGMQALLRNLLRYADLFPFTLLSSLDAENPYLMLPIATGAVGLVSMMLTRRMQRLGDLAAGTMVVIDERNWTLPVVRTDDIRVAALATFIPADFRPTATMAKALANYAERRSYLSPGRRREIARHLAVPLIERFEFRRDIDPDLLLYALYYHTFMLIKGTDEVDIGPLAGFSPLAKDAQQQAAISASGEGHTGEGGAPVAGAPAEGQSAAAVPDFSLPNMPAEERA